MIVARYYISVRRDVAFTPLRCAYAITRCLRLICCYCYATSHQHTLIRCHDAATKRAMPDADFATCRLLLHYVSVCHMPYTLFDMLSTYHVQHTLLYAMMLLRYVAPRHAATLRCYASFMILRWLSARQ